MVISETLEIGSVLLVCVEVLGKSAPHLVSSCIDIKNGRDEPDQRDQRLLSNE